MSAAAGVEQKPRSQRSQVQNGPMNPKENVGDGDFDRYMQSNLPAHQGYSSAPSMPAPDSYMPTYYPSPYSISYSIPGSETTWSTGGDSFNNFNYTSYDSSYAQDYYNQPGTTPPYLNQSFNFFPTNTDFMPGTWANSAAPAQPQGSARTQPQAQAQTPYYDYPRYQAGPNSVTGQRNYNQGLNGLDGQDGKAHGMKAMELGMSGLSIGAPIDKPGVNIAGREAVKQDVIPPKPQGPSFSQAVAGAGGAPQPPPQNTAAPKQTSWAAIVSKPAKPQPKKTTKTGSHAPVPTQLPTMKPPMTIGTWNNGEKGGAPAKPAGTATTMPSPPQSQAPPTQPAAIPPQQQQPQPPQQPPQQQQLQQPPQPQQPMPVHPQPQVQHVQPQPVAKIETPVSQPPPNTAAQAVSQQKPVLPTQEVPRRGPQAVVQPQPQQPRTWDTNGQQNRGGSNYGQRSGNQSSGTAGLAPISTGSGPKSDIDHPVLEKLRSINDYNPTTFNMDIKNSRIFVIKSYSEDDIHRSIKYGIWCSTEHGNRRLDAAFRERQNKGPIYLIYSVNGSGHFCGVAEMMSEVDIATNTGVWAQDKWKGRFDVRWIYVKDVPNNQLRHIRLENNDNKPVTNSRDTQEVLLDKGKQVMKIIHNYRHDTSIFDDFSHYEKRQEEDSHRRVGGHGGGHGGRRGGHRN